ncbi:hypothetical protein E1301_Tti004829 [Triplophysa tibetana]|uniref:Uncharacterized protein n=1 Tax=Triplophysa tibetana TaxID=1572043 RepID=A0A5A9NRT6_9TELE|nr:hypothetical protein E1301_Tti004829 [Triplophysa tibetana]
MFGFMGLMNGTTDTHTNVSCTCNCKRSTSFQSMAINLRELKRLSSLVLISVDQRASSCIRPPSGSGSL